MVRPSATPPSLDHLSSPAEWHTIDVQPGGRPRKASPAPRCLPPWRRHPCMNSAHPALILLWTLTCQRLRCQRPAADRLPYSRAVAAQCLGRGTGVLRGDYVPPAIR